jgi:hypothetical protein
MKPQETAPTIRSTGTAGRHPAVPADPVRPFDPRALAAQGDRRVLPQWIVDPGADRLAAEHRRDHHPEQRRPAAKFAVPSTGSSTKESSSRPAAEQCRIGRRRLLAKDEGAGEALPQPRRDEPLRRLVRLRHQVERAGFGTDVARRQAAEARHDVRPSRLGEQDRDGARLRGAELQAGRCPKRA